VFYSGSDLQNQHCQWLVLIKDPQCQWHLWLSNSGFEIFTAELSHYSVKRFCSWYNTWLMNGALQSYVSNRKQIICANVGIQWWYSFYCLFQVQSTRASVWFKDTDNSYRYLVCANLLKFDIWHFTIIV